MYNTVSITLFTVIVASCIQRIGNLKTIEVRLRVRLSRVMGIGFARSATLQEAVSYAMREYKPTQGEKSQESRTTRQKQSHASAAMPTMDMTVTVNAPKIMPDTV
jgi:DNA repair protein RadC